MEKLAIGLRFLQLYAHAAHNLISGKTFLQDHEFLGSVYKEYESSFDDVIERMIGLGENVSLLKMNSEAVRLLNAYKDPKDEKCFEILLKAEELLCEEIESLVKDKSQGTIQLLGDIANESEKRQYKIKQRIA